MYLLDTDVVSALSPVRILPNVALPAWLDANTNQLFLSVITIAEIESGIASARRRHAMRKAAQLSDWLSSILHLFADRLIALDIDVARRLGALIEHARASGHSPGWSDLAIAATAASRGYTVLSRNVRHFRGLPVSVHDPFDTLPA